MSIMEFRIECDREEDGRWIADVPEFPGILAYGATQEEAKTKVEALAIDLVKLRAKANS